MNFIIYISNIPIHSLIVLELPQEIDLAKTLLSITKYYTSKGNSELISNIKSFGYNLALSKGWAATFEGIQNQFANVDKKIADLDSKVTEGFEGVNKNFEDINIRLNGLENLMRQFIASNNTATSSSSSSSAVVTSLNVADSSSQQSSMLSPPFSSSKTYTNSSCKQSLSI